MEFTPAPAVHRVLCADCGIAIEPNSANLCISCLRNSVDITEGIPKQSSVSFCRNCDRFLSPPAQWTIAQPESRELLAICLKKLKGLNKVRLVDAGFIWTEPHSKRIKVKLTIQKEVFTSTILQQIFQVEYLVQHGQCPDCTRLAAKNTWKALVQVRQKVPHKRTFLFLEQLILKHGAQKDTISVKEVKDGLDFFYAQRSHAIRMVEFLAGVVPVRTKSSEQLLSTDTHSNTANYKFTYSVEIVPLCKDDLVCLPLKQARSLGNISQLTVCTRVGNSFHLLDPSTLQGCDITAPVYWRTSFDALASVTDLVEFTVLDVEPSGPTRGKLVLADAQVARAGAFRSHVEDDMEYEGTLDQIYHTRTHLGAILQPGDTALGYHLSAANFNSDEYAGLSTDRIPDVVLVKKTYPARRKKSKARMWRLKSMAKEVEEDAQNGDRRGMIGKMGGRDQKKVEEDYELFLRDLEEDLEMRGSVNMYKAEGAGSGLAGGKNRALRKSRKAAAAAAAGQDTEMDESAPSAESEAVMEDVGEVDEEEEEEADFPEVKLDELLDDFEELAIADDEDTPVTVQVITFSILHVPLPSATALPLHYSLHVFKLDVLDYGQNHAINACSFEMAHQTHVHNSPYNLVIPPHFQDPPTMPAQHRPYNAHYQAPHMMPPQRRPHNVALPPVPMAVPMAARQAVLHHYEMQSAGGVNTATIRTLADHFDRMIASSQHLLLERMSKQDAVLVKQQELLDSLAKLCTDGRNESVKGQESLRIEVSDIAKKMDRLTNAVNDGMKLLASGTIKAITECRATLERRLFCIEESCEGLKEEVRDPQAYLDTPVYHEAAVGPETPIQRVSYCNASTSAPSPEVLPSTQPAASDLPLLTPTIVHEDESASTHSSLPSLESIPDSREIITHEEETVLSYLDQHSPKSDQAIAHEVDLTLTSSNFPFPEPGPASVHEEEELVSTNSSQAFPDSVLGSAYASSISLPEPSTLLEMLCNTPKEMVSHVTPARPPVPSKSSLFGRAKSLSPLSSLSEDPFFTPRTKLSAPAPDSRRENSSRTAAGSLTPSKRRLSPGPSHGKAAKRPRNSSKFKITKRMKEELMDGDGACQVRTRRRKPFVPSTLGFSWPKLTATNDAKSRLFIQCDKCDLWYHWGCVGIRDNDCRLQDNEVFECPPCKGGKGKAIHLSRTKEGQSKTCSRADCDVDDSAVKEYFVEKIIGRFDRKIAGPNRFSWLIKWEGYPAEEATWTPGTELLDPAKLIEDFTLATEEEGISRSTLTLLKEAVAAGWAKRRA